MNNYISSFYFITLACALLCGAQAHSQTVLWTKSNNDSSVYQAMSYHTNTNISKNDFSNVRLHTTNVFAVLRCVYVSENKVTNVLCQETFIDYAPKAILGLQPGINVHRKPIIIYDMYYDPSNNIAALLYCQDAQYLYCKIYACPPYPGVQIHKPDIKYGHDVCCEVGTNDKYMRGPFIKSARIEYLKNKNEVRVGVEYTNDKMEILYKYDRVNSRWISEP